MTLSRLLAQTITITHVTAGTTDQYGDATVSTSTTSSPGRIDQLSTDEQIASGDITTSLSRLFLPAGTPLASGDRVTVQGDSTVYQVNGVPDIALGATTEHHIEALLKSIEG